MLDGTKNPSTGGQTALGYVLRLFWMAFGNIALFFAWLRVASSEHFGSADALYGTLVVALLLARWVDITKLNGMTIRTEPATRAHLRRYALGLVGVGLVGWAAARGVSALGT